MLVHWARIASPAEFRSAHPARASRTALIPVPVYGASMRAIRRPLAVDGLIAALCAAAMIELWLSRRDSATVVTTVLALGATATLLARRGAPAVAVLSAPAAQAALLAPMSRPMITMAIALAVTAAVAGAASAGRTRASWTVAVAGAAAVVAVGADYALRVRQTDRVAALGIIVAALAVCWTASILVVRRRSGRAADATEARDAATNLGDAVPAAAVPAVAVPAVAVPAVADPAVVESARSTVPRQARSRSTPAEPADPGLSARRLAVARTLADTVAGSLSLVIVEAVAAQQALVRDAHPDDALMRMRAAEEHAHDATADLRRLLAVTAVVEPVAATPDAVSELADR